MKTGQKRRQPDGGGRFHRSDDEPPFRLALVAERLFGLPDQADDPFGIVEEQVAGGGQGDALLIEV